MQCKYTIGINILGVADIMRKSGDNKQGDNKQASLYSAKPSRNANSRMRVLTQSDHHIFSQLQQSIAEHSLQPLTLTMHNSCRCKICSQISPGLESRSDHYLTQVHTYTSFFTLLLHLTLIQTHEATTLLGKINIPLLFFKKIGKQGKSGSKPKTKAKNTQGQSDGMQFILFRTDPKTGLLEHPFPVTSLSNVCKLLKSNQQRLRKQKQAQTLTLPLLLQKQDRNLSQNFIHKKLFNEQVPSYMIHPSTSPRSPQGSIRRFILHQEDRYIKEEDNHYEVKETQPFCIFRYSCVGDGDPDREASKYQIFTKEGFDLYDKNHRKGTTSSQKSQNLQLKYIQSFTRMLPIQPTQSPPTTESTYFCHYSYSSPPTSPLFTLLQQLLTHKHNPPSQIDPAYRNPIYLQQQLQQILNSHNDPLSTQSLQIKALYNSYMIVHVLEIVCKIQVDVLGLKWIVNFYGELVLLECLEYRLQRGKRDRGDRKYRDLDARVKHILDSGIQYLHQGYRIADVHEMYQGHRDIQRFIQIKLQEKRQKIRKQLQQKLHRQQQQEPPNPPKMPKKPSPTKKLQSLSRSLDVKQSSPSPSICSYIPKMRNPKPILNNNFDRLLQFKTNTHQVRRSMPSSVVSFASGVDMAKGFPIGGDLQVGLGQSMRSKVRVQKRKKYRLRPLKTELSSLSSSIFE